MSTSCNASGGRGESRDLAGPLEETGLAILGAKDAPVQSVADLQTPGRKVVVRLGTTGESWARQYRPKAEIKALDLDTSCVLEVVNGNVDAWVYDQLSIMNYQAKHPEKTRALLAPLREESWAVGLRQGDEAKKTLVNETLARMRKDGSFAKLAEQFMAKEREMMKQQGLPFVFELP